MNRDKELANDNYINKGKLEKNNETLYEKVELNFVKAKKLQPAIDEVRGEVQVVQQSLEAF